ncbi:Holliday junction resolvase RuvX [Candidatus Chlorohelix sp.]|uniref:Holliday junction resolvase RuvX n=1 Tax=Candidatus Chlorohelix sp. TaxID=3139201 RepID=UPI003072BE30
MRYLALDLGRKRIGLALSDETGLISSPAGVIQVRNPEQVFTEIVALVKQNEVGKLVIGLPIQLNGREGIEAERARVFASELAGRISVPVDFMDERLSSVEAERRLIDSGKRGQKIKDNIDATAAALILQTYLDRERRRSS